MKISWMVNTLGNIYTSLWNKDLRCKEQTDGHPYPQHYCMSIQIYNSDNQHNLQWYRT